MGINTALVLAGVGGAGTSGGDLAWFAPTGSTAPTDATTALAVGTNEVQTVTITGTPTGGTFTLTLGGQTTTPIAYNASSTTVQAALQAISSIGTGNATVSGSAGGPYVVTFTSALAGTDVATMTATGSFTGGTTPAVAVTTTTPGTSIWRSAGLVTENGVAKDVKENSNSIPAFGIAVPIRKIVKSSEITMKLTFLETNKTTQELFNRLPLGSLTVTAGAFSTTDGAFRAQRYAACFQVVDGPNNIRMYAPNVEVTNRDSLAIKNGEAIEYGIELTAYPDNTGGAVYTFVSATGLI